MQFTCETGRIILCLKHHDWNRSAISSMFRQISSSNDFVEMWESEVVSASESVTAIASNNDQQSRKRASSSFDSSTVQATSDNPVTNSGPPATKKRCNYVNQGLDQRIEKCRKGYILMPYIV